MKKMGVLMVLILFLTGCSARQTFETVEDVYAPEAVPEPAQIVLTLPEDASTAVLAGASGKLFFCDGYEIAVETLSSGNLDRTLKDITGYGREELTVFATDDDGTARYECVWTSAGEQGDRIGRAVILDDGNYHYCVSVMADAEEAGSLQASWQTLLRSVSV